VSIKLPRHVKIGPIMFSVESVKQVGRNEKTWGAISHWKAKIKIKNGVDGGLSVKNQAVSLMHEIIHGTLTYMGYNELSDDEPFVERLSEAMTDTLWNSPGLLRYLKETKKA